MTRTEKILHYISIVLKVFIGVLVLISVWRQDYFLAVVSLFILFFTFLPAIVSRSFKINLPVEIDFLLTIILYTSYGLGEYGGFYVRFFWWDLFLHAGYSLILGMVGFIFAYSLLITSRIKAKPLFIALFAVSFAVFAGVVWEIFEFSMDQVFGLTMQKSGLVDTMTDLLVDSIGAITIGLIGFFYIKNPKPGIIHSIVTKFVDIKDRD
ncbi:hypothetical protein BMS3Abin15_00495 [bacterium BMS3Abin15]|nr:hypothetical protein BMS3Abin15_00495 [bacterium BMS3Abin15]HDZ85566.1 hypothetical protein [Candidatus Moranbacteria bacterium]